MPAIGLTMETLLLEDDGLVPNSRLPVLLYRSALTDLLRAHPETAFQRLFEGHGWCGIWVNGIYPFHHYHARSHEALGIAAGAVLLQLGGRGGPVVRLEAGDALVIPAGVGHCRLGSDEGLLVVGAYPPGQDAWDLKRATVTDRARALLELPGVALARQDPVLGAGKGLVRLWR